MPNSTYSEHTSSMPRQSGVTLIELMIVVVVVAVLAAIVVPSYQQYTMESKRSDAHAALTTLQNHQERFYSENNGYAANNVLTTNAPNGLGYTNTNSPNNFYTLSIAVGNTNSIDSSYSLTATAQGQQLNDSDCRTLTLDSTGAWTATNSGGSASDACW